MWMLFLDDIRVPSDVYSMPHPWEIARSYDEALALIAELGLPGFISFDHDLGDQVPTGFDLAKYIVESDLNTGQLPVDFDYHVHSANPPGLANIKGLLDGYLKFKRNSNF